MVDASQPSASPGSTNGASAPLPETLEKLARLRLGHEAVMLEDAREVLAQSRKGVAAVNQLNGLPEASGDMGPLILGDTTINQQPQQQSKLSPLAKGLIGIAAGLAVGGPIGAGLALPGIINALKPAAPVVQPQQPAGTDTDTLFDLFVGPPREGG